MDKIEKVGVVLNNLSFSQLAYYFIQNTNKYIQEDFLFNVIGFYENCVLPCLPCSFATMPVSEIYGYDSTLITTDLNTTARALRAFGPTSIYFYVWDLEWLRMPQKHWHDLINIYGNPNLKLICRSAEHASVIEKCWNIKVLGVCEDWDWPTMRNLIDSGDFNNEKTCAGVGENPIPPDF